MIPAIPKDRFFPAFSAPYFLFLPLNFLIFRIFLSFLA